MPRFYFDMIDGDLNMPDRDGSELTDVAAAYREALKILHEISEELQPADGLREMSVEIRSESRRRLHTLSLTLSAGPFADDA